VELACFGLCVAQGVYLAASFVHGSWIFDPAGQLIATDFVNVWASGRQALDGDPTGVYDVAVHKDAEVAALRHSFAGEYPWIYPPIFFFAAVVLALLPYVPAYAAWVVLTLCAYVATVRAIIGHRLGILLACAYPGILSNLMVGQNGFASAALVGGALISMERAPVLSGCLIGLLSFKPHLGILFPLVLIAGRHWRVMTAAAVTTMVLALASLLVFGPQAWQAFFESLPVASQSALSEGRADWAKMQSLFVTVRMLGGSLETAWALQLLLVGTAAAMLWCLWRSETCFELKAAALATAALLVSPYLFLYDLMVLAIAMAFLIRTGGRTGFLPGEMPALACAAALILVFPLTTGPVGLAAILIVAMLIGRRLRLYQPDAPARLPAAAPVQQAPRMIP
jgi:hypothetical protein